MGVADDEDVLVEDVLVEGVEEEDETAVVDMSVTCYFFKKALANRRNRLKC